MKAQRPRAKVKMRTPQANTRKFDKPPALVSKEWVEDASSDSPADFKMDLRRFVGLVRRQLKLILAIIIAVCALTVLVILQLTPLYNSTALVMADPRQNNGIDPATQTTFSTGDMARVDTEVEIVRSPAVFLSAIGNLHLLTDPELSPSPGLVEWITKIVGFEAAPISSEDKLKIALRQLQASVKISRSGLTYLIEITAESKRPERAAELANAIADAYIRSQIDSKIELVGEVQRALQSRVEEAGTALRNAEGKLDTFVEDSLLSVAGTSQGELAILKGKIAEKSAESQKLERLVGDATKGLENSDWQHLVDELNSESLRMLNAKRVSLAAALENTPERQAINLRQQLASLDKQMSEQARSAIDGLQKDLAQAQASERDLRQNLQQRVLSSDLPKDLLVGLYQMQQEVDATRSVYQNLLNRSKTVNTQRELQLPDSRIISRALPPPIPSYPRKKLILAVAGLGSLLLALGVAFVRENYVGGLTDEEQLQSVMGIPALGSVPKLSDGSSEDVEADEVVSHPLSPYSEGIRRVRLALDAAHTMVHAKAGLKAPQIILVTSALPGEGKSQTAVSISRSHALAGRRVLLIDCDLRRPTLHKVLGLKPGGGLASYLSSDDWDGSCEVVDDSQTPLRVILGSPAWRFDTMRLLENSRMGELLRAAKQDFEIIVIDSSPLLPVVDARLLTQYASAVVLVVQSARTSQHAVRAALNDLRRYVQPGTLIGSVLNRVERDSAGYGYGGYYLHYTDVS